MCNCQTIHPGVPCGGPGCECHPKTDTSVKVEELNVGVSINVYPENRDALDDVIAMFSRLASELSLNGMGCNISVTPFDQED